MPTRRHLSARGLLGLLENASLPPCLKKKKKKCFRLHAVNRPIKLHAVQSSGRGEASTIGPSSHEGLNGVDEFRRVR